MRIVWWIAIFMSWACGADAQVRLILKYDSLTYADYQKGDWQQLKRDCLKATKRHAKTNNILKRLGYAHYMQQNYLASAYHYEEVYDKNQNDPDSKIMLYRNFANVAMDAECRYINGSYSGEERSYLQLPKPSVLVSADMNGGAAMTNNIARNNAKDLMGVYQLYGQQQLNGNVYFYGLGMRLSPVRWMSVYVAYNGVTLNKEDRVMAMQMRLIRSGNPTNYNGHIYPLSSYQFGDTAYSLNQNVQQHQAYLQTSFVLPRFVTVKAYVHLVTNSYRSLSVKEDSVLYLSAPPAVMRLYENNRYSFANPGSSAVDYVAGISVSKQIREVKIEIEGSVSRLNQKRQYMTRGIVTWYPFGNTNLSLAAQLSYVYQDHANRYIPRIDATVKVWKRLWLNANGCYGDMSNLTEYNGMVVQNITDRSIYRVGGGVYVSLSDHISMTVAYGAMLRQNWSLMYTDDSNYQLKWTNYFSHILSIGLKYKL